MGIFDLFKNKEELRNSPWLTIESSEDLDKVVEESKHSKVAIFKHSTSCFISKMVLRNFEADLNKQTLMGINFIIWICYVSDPSLTRLLNSLW